MSMKLPLRIGRVRRASAIFSDTSGMAIIEFAYTVPVLLALYLGGAQLCDTIAAYRKLTTATRAIADLGSQYSSVSDADLDQVLAASAKVMAPYSLGNATLSIIQVSMDANNNPTVTWGRSINATPPADGTTYNLPTSIRVPSTSVVISEVTYNYVPSFGAWLIPSIPLKEKIIMSPRSVVNITKKVT
jgi:Flp pilus assembly protein TadG